MNGLFDLTGQVALCTGAGSGLGQRMAWALSQAGAKVVLVARTAYALESTKLLILESGGQAECVPADLSKLTQMDEVVKQVSQPFGAPDIIVNAAGVNLREAPNDISVDSWQSTLDINLSAPFFLAQALTPAMIEKGHGKIINIASLQSYRAFDNSMAYGATKGGITQLTRAMAQAWSKHGINANAIAPGFFETPLTEKVFQNSALAAHHASMTAIGRNGQLDDIDGLCVFLASRASDYITGQVIALDGGYLAK